MELLRIISMIMIIISHYSVHGATKTFGTELTINKLIIDSSNFGDLGVAIFVMISGYFMCEKRFDINRVINIVISTVSYSVVLFILFVCIGQANLGVSSIIRAVFPVVTGEYWFVTSFVILMFLAPFINRLLDNMIRRERLLMIVVLTSIFFFFNTISFSYIDLASCGSHTIRFILYYCIGAYVKKYPNNYFNVKKRSRHLLWISLILLLLSAVVMDLLGTRIAFFDDRSSFFYKSISLLMLFVATMFLITFSNINPFYNSIINIFGGCTFGVYLLHDNNYMRTFLWNNVFNNSIYYNSKLLIVHFAISVIIVYLFCTCIEYIRKSIFEKYIFKGMINKVNSIADNIVLNINNLLESIIRKY